MHNALKSGCVFELFKKSVGYENAIEVIGRCCSQYFVANCNIRKIQTLEAAVTARVAALANQLNSTDAILASCIFGKRLRLWKIILVLITMGL